MNSVIRTINKPKNKRSFVGAWVDGKAYAAIEKAAKKNQRSLAGEIRFRILKALAA